MKRIIQISPLVLLLLFIFSIQTSKAQGNAGYETAKAEIIQTFGKFPSFFEVFPKHALHGTWEKFKQLGSSEAEISPKNKELIQLAVAAQIPCDYCIYFHTASAKAFGASEEEIREAIAYGADTRHWSMILQGNQIQLEDFKKEFQEMMEYMAAAKEGK